MLKSYRHDDEQSCVECAFVSKADAQKCMMGKLRQELADIAENEGLDEPQGIEVNDTDKFTYGEMGEYHYGYRDIESFIDYEVVFTIESCDLIPSSEKRYAYIATNEEKHEGSDVEFFAFGQYDTAEEAMKVLQRQFEDDSDCLSSDEYNDGWKLREIGEYGSFEYYYDDYNYYRYNIKRVEI